MAMTIRCPACRQIFQIRDDLAGKRVRCRCGQALAVPAAARLDDLIDEFASAPAPARLGPSPHRMGQAATLRSRYPKRKRSAKSASVGALIGAGTIGVVSVIAIVALAIRSLAPVGVVMAPSPSDANAPPKSGIVAPSSAFHLGAELERIRASGEPVSLDDLEGFYQTPRVAEDTTQRWLTGLAPLGTPQFKSSANGLPFVGGGPESIPWPSEAWPQLAAAERFLSSYRGSLDHIHEAAARDGRARFPVRFAAGANMPLPHLEQLRTAVRVLALESAVAAHRGQLDSAAESVVAMFAAARSIEQEPVLVSQLVRMALGGMARGRVEWLLSAAALSDAQLARLDAELSASDYREPVRRALLGERVIGILGFTNPALALTGVDARQASRLPKSPDDEPMYLQLMCEMVAAVNNTGSARKRAADAAEARLKELARTRNANRRYPLTLLIVPAVGACADAAGYNEGARDAARVAVAIERFRHSEGRLPSKLDELVPSHLRALPIDPGDGAQLRYRIDSTEYLVYSVGADAVDDGGRPAPPGQRGDIVVRVRRKDAGGAHR